MKKTIIISFSALAVMALMATMALAGPGYGRNMGQGWQQLSAEQQEQAGALFDTHQEKVQPIRNQLLAKHMTLQAMVNGGDADEKAITKLVGEISDLHQELRAERDSFHQALADAGLDFGRGWGNGYAPCSGKGFGSGQGKGMGQGFGPCGGYGGGMGMGPCGGGFGPGGF